MSDFLKWLYAQYIRPQLAAAPREEYEAPLDLIHNVLDPHARESYEKTLEFTAIHAFLLGLRTGRGLPGLNG